MSKRTLISSVLAGLAILAAGAPARALGPGRQGGGGGCCDSGASAGCCGPATSFAGAPGTGAPGTGAAPGTSAAAPTTRVITVMEMVPEQYVTTRTTYKSVNVNETYTAYRTECVPEQRTV